MYDSSERLPIPLAIGFACQWEAVAAKPGNVHRLADFADMGLVDFLGSGTVVAHVTHQWLPKWSCVAESNTKIQAQIGGQSHDTQTLVRSRQPSFGEFIYEAIQATRQVTSANTNLGICLLLGPLAESWAMLDSAAFRSELQAKKLEGWREAVQSLVQSASVTQTRWLYRAIAAAKPGGMGQVPEADLSSVDTLTDADSVVYVMSLASERDTIAAEYTSGFQITFLETAPTITSFVTNGYGWHWAIIGTYLRLLAARPDTLIARKVGSERAQQVTTWALQLVERYFPNPVLPWPEFQEIQEQCESELADFDFALRADGNRLNPGTTADLIAAGLFVCLASGERLLPIRW